jgi:hypothetical protein
MAMPPIKHSGPSATPPRRWQAAALAQRRRLVEQPERLLQILIDAAAQLVHEAKDEHGVGVVLGDRLIEPGKGGGVVAGNTHTFIVSASEQCLTVCVALGRHRPSVVDRVSVVA